MILYLTAAAYVCIKLRGILVTKNYLTIATFGFIITIRGVMISYIYWVFTNRGNSPFYFGNNNEKFSPDIQNAL